MEFLFNFFFGVDRFLVDKDISSFIEEVVERFVGYIFVNYGLFIIFCFVVERCVVIYFFFK